MYQLTLWQDEQQAPIKLHQHMEVVWSSGHCVTFCTEGEKPPKRPGDWEWEAGFVGFPVQPEQCSICNTRKTTK